MFMHTQCMHIPAASLMKLAGSTDILKKQKASTIVIGFLKLFLVKDLQKHIYIRW